MSDIRSLVNSVLARYMGSDSSSFPAVNGLNLEVGAEEYARKHKPASGQLGLFEKPSEKQKPLFSKKVDDEGGRWVTMRGARVYISNDDGRVMKGPKRLMGKTGAQIEAEGKAAGKGEKTPKPKGLNELGRISGGKKENRQGKLFEEINPGFKWDEDDDVTTIEPSDEKMSAMEAAEAAALDENGTLEGPEAEHDYKTAYLKEREKQKSVHKLIAGEIVRSLYDGDNSYFDVADSVSKDIVDHISENDGVPDAKSIASIILENVFDGDEEYRSDVDSTAANVVSRLAVDEPFSLSEKSKPEPKKPETFTNTEATKQGALFDSGKGKGDLPGQELLFNSDAGDVGNPKTMENRVKDEPKSVQSLTPDERSKLPEHLQNITPVFPSETKKLKDMAKSASPSPAVKSPEDTIAEHLQNNDHESAYKAFGQLKKAEIDSVARKVLGSGFYNQSKSQMLEALKRALPFATKQATEEQEKKDEISSAEKALSRAKENQQRHSEGLMGAPIRKGVPEIAYSDPHGKGREEVAKAWQAEVDEAQAALDKLKKKDRYSRIQAMTSDINAIADRYLRPESEAVQIDHYAHPLVHAAVGGLGHMAVQSLVKNTTMRRMAHALVASAMAAWMASANAGNQGQTGQWNQGQAPSPSPAVKQNDPISMIVQRAFQKHQQAVAAAVNEKQWGPVQEQVQGLTKSQSINKGEKPAVGKKPLTGEESNADAVKKPHLPFVKPDSNFVKGGTAGVLPATDTAGKGEESGSSGFSSADHPRHPAGAPESQGGEFAPKGEGSTSGEPAGTGENEGGSRNYPDNLNKPADQQTSYSPPDRGFGGPVDEPKSSKQMQDIANSRAMIQNGEMALQDKSLSPEQRQKLESEVEQHRSDVRDKAGLTPAKEYDSSAISAPASTAYDSPEDIARRKSRAADPNSSWKSAMAGATERLEQQKSDKQQARKQANQQKKAAQQQEQATSFNPDELSQSSQDDSDLISGEDSTPYDDKPKPDDFKREKDYQRALKAWNREKGARKASVSKKIAKSVVPSIALEYELSEEELSSAVNDSIAMESEGLKRQEEARKYVVDRGYNAGRINRNEDSGIDHSSSQLDEFASEWAGLYPEIAGSDESQWVDRMWNLAKAGTAEIPSAGDEDFVRKVAERLHSSREQNSSSFPADSGSDSNPAPVHGQVGDVDFTPFSRNSLVDSLNLIVDRYMRETINTKLHVT